MFDIIKWNQDMSYKGWPRFEVRSSPADEDTSYTVVESGILIFSDAWRQVKKLEALEIEKKQKMKGTE